MAQASKRRRELRGLHENLSSIASGAFLPLAAGFLGYFRLP
jgi:hypothetical protein